VERLDAPMAVLPTRVVSPEVAVRWALLVLSRTMNALVLGEAESAHLEPMEWRARPRAGQAPPSASVAVAISVAGAEAA
jgi:hypothetical protein